MQTFVKNNRYEILGENGWENFDGIIITEEDNIKIRKIKTTNNWIECTNEHKLYDEDNNEIKTIDIKQGTKIQTINGIEEVIDISESYTNIVYDIFNSDSHKIFTNGIKNHQCDEFGFVRKNAAEDFWAANYPALAASRESRIVVVSTPNGMFNLFHRLYAEAEAKKNEFRPIRVRWDRVPGRDAKWAEVQKKNLGDIKFAQEFDTEFLGSTATIIDPDVLKVLLVSFTNPLKVDLKGRLRYYEFPVQGAQYIIGGDPSKGTGLHDACLQVLKIEQFKPIKLTQVAVFQDNKTDTYELAGIINRLSIYYNNARIIVENNGEGAPVASHLWWTYENANLYNSGTKNNDLGLRSNVRTKSKAVSLMKKIVEDNSIRIVDQETVKQLSMFVEEKNKFCGKDGAPDDLVDALFWAIYGIDLSLFDETAEINILSGNNEDVWGVLADVPEYTEEDWSWVTSL